MAELAMPWRVLRQFGPYALVVASPADRVSLLAGAAGVEDANSLSVEVNRMISLCVEHEVGVDAAVVNGITEEDTLFYIREKDGGYVILQEEAPLED